MTGLLITTDENQQVIMPENPNKGFTLDECYKLMNCDMIEIVKLSDGRVMIVDENGKDKEDAKINKAATKLYQKGRMSAVEYRKQMREKYGNSFIDLSEDDPNADDIVGDVIVCSPDMIK